VSKLHKKYLPSFLPSKRLSVTTYYIYKAVHSKNIRTKGDFPVEVMSQKIKATKLHFQLFPNWNQLSTTVFPQQKKYKRVIALERKPAVNKKTTTRFIKTHCPSINILKWSVIMTNLKKIVWTFWAVLMAVTTMPTVVVEFNVNSAVCLCRNGGNHMFEFERVCSMEVLRNLWQKIAAKGGAPGIDNIDISFYRSNLPHNLRSLQTAIATENYKPYADKIFTHKNRNINISSIDDKIVQSAISNIILSVYNPPQSVHGFIKNRSVFSAKKALDYAIAKNIPSFSKIDIKRFYDSIDTDILLQKISQIIGDKKFLHLVEKLLSAHTPGISTGSCLSPTVSNLYLAEFDNFAQRNSQFYARYVDDILVAPANNINILGDKLSEIGLNINFEKSKTVNVYDGFKYLGFDIKHTVDTAIQRGNFALAEKIYTPQESDVAASVEPALPKAENASQNEYEAPTHISNVIKNCGIVKIIVFKAKAEKYLGYPDKTTLLQIFHCLGKDGEHFIHHTLSNCLDYDYAETQRHINKYSAPGPVGCKKLSDRYDDKCKCVCNFSQDKTIYPTPIIHALRVKSDCFIPNTPKDHIGHFKGKTPKHKAEDAISSLLTLNKKAFEIQAQQGIFKGQIENLFDKMGIIEIQTPHGLLVKNNDGIFIKVG